MIIFLNILISFFFSLSQLYAQDLIKDEDYYNTGVNHYDNGDFKESFIVFFNLSEKGNKAAGTRARKHLQEIRNLAKELRDQISQEKRESLAN